MEKYRILVVDDEEDIRTVVTQVLRNNYEVAHAHDGLDALEKLNTVEPDFVIMDIMMPLMDGFKACEAIRKDARFGDVPVLFLSALNAKEDIKKGYSSGANLYLTKPFDPFRLLRNIDLHFEDEDAPPRAKRHTIQELEDLLQSRSDSVPPDSSSVSAQRSPSDLPSTEPYLEKFHDASRRSRTDSELADETASDHDPIEEMIIAPMPTPPPRRAVGDSSTPSPSRVSPRSDSTPVDRTRVRVMVVDDDSGIRTIVKTGLSGKFEVVTASDGLEAIELIVLYEPDVILIDSMMPRMSGYQLCQSLRKNRRYQRTPILFISGKSSPKDIAYAKRVGADDFISKPFDIDDLIAHIEDITMAPSFQVYAKNLSIKKIEQKLHEMEEERSNRQKTRQAAQALHKSARDRQRLKRPSELESFLHDEQSKNDE